MLRHLSRLLGCLCVLLSPSVPIGVIDADVSLPISNTVANLNELADYTFRFNLTTKLLQGGYVQIVFPLQFESGLGIPFLPSCSVKCSRIDRTVNFYFTEDLFPSIIYNVTIKNVLNPDRIGGTSQFIIRTYRGANIIDESLMHGLLGFGGSIGTMTSTTVAVDSSSSTAAGEIAKYIFSFRTDMDLPQNIYFKLQLPLDTFEVSRFPSCSSFAINGKQISGVFTCSYNSILQSIEVRGIGQAIVKDSDVGVLVSMRNPKYSYTTNPFQMYVMKEGTTMAFTRKLEIKGVPITAGKITQISMYPLDAQMIISKSKLVWYGLQFKLRNSLNTGAIITIKKPSTISYGTLPQVEGVETVVYVQKGLDDISDSNPLKVAISGDFIIISNFKSMTQPSLIVVAMLITTPPSAGYSSPFEIASYTDLSQSSEIDKDVSEARIMVSEIDAPLANSVATPAYPSGPVADGSTLVDIVFTMTPSKTLLQSGLIKILIDERISATGVSNTNCKVFNTKTNQYVQSPSCYKRDRDIFMRISETEYTVGVSRNFELNGVIRSPSVGGTYYFEIQLISPTGNIQESYTQVFEFNAKAITDDFQINLVPRSRYLKSVHEIAFSTPYLIPAAKVQQTATDTTSYIKLTYMKDPVYASYSNNHLEDLGYPASTVPKRVSCRAIRGLNAIYGTSVNCTLTQKTESSEVKINNFQQVPQGNNILLYLPVMANPYRRFKILIEVFVKENRLFTKLCENFKIQDVIYSSTSTRKSGIGAPINLAHEYEKTNFAINTDFSVNWVAQISPDFPGDSRVLFIMPEFDNGYLPEEGHVTCRLKTTFFSCVTFKEGLNWIYATVGPDQTIPSGLKGNIDRWYIENLRWPQYDLDPLLRPEATTTFPQPPGKTELEINVITQNSPGDFRPQSLFDFEPFRSPKLQPFLKAKLNVDKKRQGEVDATYTFTFICNDDIPNEGYLELTMPVDYNMVQSFPPVEITYPEFESADPVNKPLFHKYQKNWIKIYNIKKLYRKTEFRIIIKGLRNPIQTAPMNDFNVETRVNDKLVNRMLTFTTVTLQGEFTPGKIDINYISLFPINKLIASDYTFAFVPRTKLSVGSEIHFRFPPEYSFLPQNPFCNVWGGISTFEVCYRLVNEIVVKLDSNYFTDVIYVRINGITNPNFDKSSPFYIYTTYDGATLDETKADTAASRVVNFKERASLLSMREFFYNPVNEGEVATYTISFIPTNNIEKGMNIYVRFPDTFDMRLGKEVDIFVKSGLKGDIKTKMSERVITISEFDKYDLAVGKPIKIMVTGVVNPAKPETGHSGYISVGTIYPGTKKFVDYLAKAGSVLTTSAPGWLALNYINQTNLYSRTLADYSFNITITDKIEKTDYLGAIWVDLPKNFELVDTTYKCSNLTANLGSTLRCSQTKRLIKIKGHPEELIRDTGFTIKRIKNPLDEVKSESFFVRTYEGFSRQIVQRSFENLDPVKLQYTYPGPLIIVNDNKPIYVEKGTQTKDLYITMSEICALNLTFIPVTPGFSFVPSEIKLSIGEVKTKFRVSVPMGFTEGEYDVEWLTKNDFEPPIYTPIKKTRVVITGKGSIPLMISKVNDVPYLGNSLPIIFSTDYAPDIGIDVLVSLDKTYDGIGLDKQSVQFIAGTNLNTFMVYFNDKTIPLDKVTQSGTIYLQLIGVNKDIYSLPTEVLTFNVITEDKRTPEITDILLLEKTQTTARIQFSCSDIATAYWVLALKGTAQPPLEEMKTFGPAEYGVYYVGQDQTGTLTFEDLTAETEYVVHVLLEDRGFNQIEAPGFLEFKTADRYNAAFITLKFNQNYINSAERELISDQIAFQLSLLPFKVQQSKYTYQQLQGRLLQEETERVLSERVLAQPRGLQVQEETSSKVTFTVLAEPTSPVYPPPVELSKLLNLPKKKERMFEAFSNYDKTYVIEPIEFKRYEVGFSVTPQIIGVSFDEVNITCNLDNYGFIYAVAVKKDDDLGKPSPFQISKGLDYRNIPLPSNYVEIDTKFVSFNLTVSYLDSDTDYNLYMSAGSAHPGYPDLMNENKTIFLEFHTLKAPEKPRLNIDGSGMLKMAWTLLALLLVIFVGL